MKRFKWFNNLKKKFKPPVEVKPISLYNPFNDVILQDLKLDRTPLTIHFADLKAPFVSILLDIDVNKQFLVLDEINTSLGHRLACSGEPFSISGSHNGIPLLFNSEIIDHSEINGISFYRIPYPRNIEYLQRRITSRLNIPFDIQMVADFLLPNKPLIRANIMDISLTGMRLSIPHNVKSLLDNFTKIEYCRIHSPFLPAHGLAIDIKHAQYVKGKLKTVVGCQFLNIDNLGLRFLSQLVTRLQGLKVEQR